MLIHRSLPVLFAIAVTAMAHEARAQSLFDQGRVRIGVGLAAGTLNDQTYFIIGASAGYFVLPGLELGTSFDTWLGNSPNVTRLAPELKYVLDIVDVVKPYLGGFYRRWIVGDGIRDFDSVGGRGGLIFVQGQNAFIQAGAVYEHYVTRCDADCSTWYPEIGIALVF